MADTTKHHAMDHDTTYTPYEKRVREGMNVRRVQYGFFRVAKEPVYAPRCCSCERILEGSHLVINGIHYCNYDCRKLDQ